MKKFLSILAIVAGVAVAAVYLLSKLTPQVYMQEDFDLEEE